MLVDVVEFFISMDILTKRPVVTNDIERKKRLRRRMPQSRDSRLLWAPANRLLASAMISCLNAWLSHCPTMTASCVCT